jgi:hypothetical protein
MSLGRRHGKKLVCIYGGEEEIWQIFMCVLPWLVRELFLSRNFLFLTKKKIGILAMALYSLFCTLVGKIMEIICSRLPGTYRFRRMLRRKLRTWVVCFRDKD